MVDFSKLKANRKNQLDNIKQEVSKLNAPQNGPDERYWTPTLDKAGNGFAIIRFLPAPGEEPTPFVRLWYHGFQGPGGWYIENSLTTLGQKDPLSEYNGKLWNSGVEANKKFVQDKSKRRLAYISNIYVVKDPGNPDNEGKVFLYRYGKKIFDKLNDAMNPQFEDDPSINPFDLWEGADFKLKIRKVDGYSNYDKSEFAEPAALFDTDEDLEKVWKKEYSLQAEIGADKFKSYDELKTRMNKALGLDDEDVKPAKAETPAKTLESARKPTSKPAPKNEDVPWDTSEGDEELSFFQKLAEED